ncbi:hypothetical protein L7F22_046375 [Adiantum nelumboides]|nr:hypothetical protein [Adiantum nelumboides]
MAPKRVRIGGANDHEAGTSNSKGKGKAPLIEEPEKLHVADQTLGDSRSNEEEIIERSVGAVGTHDGMAEALAKISRRSSYFKKIEDDVQRHAALFSKIKAGLESFERQEMQKLLRFSENIEEQLEQLTDESRIGPSHPIRKLSDDCSSVSGSWEEWGTYYAASSLQLLTRESKQLYPLRGGPSRAALSPEGWRLGNPVEATDDYRAEASLCAQRRNELFARSREAWRLGNKAEAKSLSKAAKAQAKLMVEANQKAAETLFNKNNATRDVGVLDLHGLFVKEVIEKVEERIARS